jgi:hypothetical protein
VLLLSVVVFGAFVYLKRLAGPVKEKKKKNLNEQAHILHVATDSPPVVDVNGKLITLSLYKFDVYDQQQRKVLASRTQYPIITVVYPIRNGHFKMADCKSSKR